MANSLCADEEGMRKINISHIGVFVGKLCFAHCAVFLVVLTLLLFGKFSSLSTMISLIDNPWWHTGFMVAAAVLGLHEFLGAKSGPRAKSVKFFVISGMLLMVFSFISELFFSPLPAHQASGDIHALGEVDHLIRHFAFMFGNLLVVAGHWQNRHPCCERDHRADALGN